jgi:hypothetical protein
LKKYRKISIVFLLLTTIGWAEVDIMGDVDLGNLSLEINEARSLLSRNIEIQLPDGTIEMVARCGTVDIGGDGLPRAPETFSRGIGGDSQFRSRSLVIPVAFHVIRAENGYTGNLSEAEVQDQIDVLSAEFASNDISFTLERLDYSDNDDWFYNDNESAYKYALAYDPAHTLNIYTTTASGNLGYAYLPWSFSEDHYMHGVVLSYTCLPGGSYPYNQGATAVHEVGHYMGLYHTFQGGCYGSGDQVDDTPAEDDGNNIFSCNNTDTCPDDPGNDPIHNFMTYTDDACLTEFTTGQFDRVNWALETYKPSLGEYLSIPDISFQGYSLQYTEDDGDGVLNPGESAKMRVILENGQEGATATHVSAILSSNSSYIDITDDFANFPDIDPGASVVNIVDRFEFSIDSTAPPEAISLTLTITSTAGDPPVEYETVEEFDLELTLNQAGFPFTTGGSIYSSPLIFDIDQDGADEIVFGSDDYNVYALGSDGREEWSFATGNQVRGSAAAADLEGDGDVEIVFCSKDQKCYILNGDGSLQAEYSANGFLMTTPALRDLDGDGDLEIIFGGFAKYLYVIHHDGTDFGSFPLYVDESIMMAPAVGDIDNDGSDEIVVGTWSNNVWAFDLDGTVVSGFPYSAGNKINSDPALADLDGDGTLEILVGSDDNYLYSINSDGSEQFSVYSSGDVRGSPTVEDIDNDGDLEIFYGSNVKKVFGIDHEGNALSGWPQESTSTFKSAPVFADLNNSGHPAIIAATSGGTLYAWDAAGNIMDNFPIPLGGSVEGSFSVKDTDSDGDLEISVGASSSLAMIDIKTEGGSGDYWSMYRFNSTRSGNSSDFEMGVEDNYPMLPTQFVVYQNYPNPFNPSTRIRYDLPEQSFVTITIHDLLGRNVQTLVKELQDAGQQSVVWDANDANGRSISSGIYLLRVNVGSESVVQKMMYLK